MTIVPCKRFRTEEHQRSIPQSKHFFKDLPLPIEKLIFSFINISTVHSLILTNKYFRKIIPNFFVYFPLHVDHLLHFIVSRRSKLRLPNQTEIATDKYFFSLPSIWQEALKIGLQHVKNISIHLNSFSEQELTQIISTNSKLEKLDFVGFKRSMLEQVISLPNLTDLNVINPDFFWGNNPDSRVSQVWNCLSLKNLSISYIPLDILFFQTKINQTILPNLKYLSINCHIFSYTLYPLIGCIKSLTELDIHGGCVIENEILIKLTNLKSLSFFYLACKMKNFGELKNLHSLEILNIHVNDYSELIANKENLNTFAIIIKSLPNLKMVTIEYEHIEKYINSDLDSLHNVHIILSNSSYPKYCKLKIENEALEKIRSLTLKISFDFMIIENFVEQEQELPLSYYKNFFSQLNTLPRLKDIQIKIWGNVKEYEEEFLTIFFDHLAHKISSLKETTFTDQKSIWTEKIITQLKNKKLINCIKVAASFLKFDKTPFSNDEIFQLFPKLTWENLERVSKDQFAITKQRER